MIPKLEMTVNLSIDDIKEAIVDYVSKELDMIVCRNDVDIEVGTSYEDRNPGGAARPVLKGATVKVKRGTVK